MHVHFHQHNHDCMRSEICIQNIPRPPTLVKIMYADLVSSLHWSPQHQPTDELTSILSVL